MSRMIAVITYVLLAVPFVLFAAGLRGVAFLLAATYAVTWLFLRPTAFEITSEALEVVWPLRRARIPRSDIRGASIVRAADLCDEFGTLLRVGVGGLWGGFGLAWSSRGKHLGLYVSRQDAIVLVRCARARSLLITPERPEAFVATLASP